MMARYGLLTVLAMLPICGCCLPRACAAPPVYSAKPTYATVVDSETQQPIGGAVVVAAWVLYLPGGDRIKNLEVREVVTDEYGAFFIPGWGPKLRPSNTELTFYDPKLIVFKSGYEPVYLANEWTSHPSQASVRESQWNGKSIELKPFHGTPKERARQLESLLIGVCHGPPLKGLYGELQKERQALGEAGRSFFVGAEQLKEERP
jgi:hypothetical protein